MFRATVAFTVLAALPTAPITRGSTAGPAQIVIIRHAEKPADQADPHLSPEGVRRAQKLVSFITSNSKILKFGSPAAVFATKTTKDDNGQRTQETVAPLAKALKLEVQTPFHGKDYAELARAILDNPAYNGKTVVICWNHEQIPELVAALGVKPEPPKWPGSVFDRVYIIAYDHGRAALATSRYGDP